MILRCVKMYFVVLLLLVGVTAGAKTSSEASRECIDALVDVDLSREALGDILAKFKTPTEEFNRLDFDPDGVTWGRKEKLTSILGEGHNSTVVLAEEDRVFKIAYEAKSASRLLIEWLVNRDLKRRFADFGIYTDKIIGHSPEFLVLEKSHINKDILVEGIIKKNGRLGPLQVARLENLFVSAQKYARETGIGLDLKASNLYWDENRLDWVLFDCGPRISYKPMGYTLDLKIFRDYLRVWQCEEPDCSADDDQEGDERQIDQMLKDTARGVPNRALSEQLKDLRYSSTYALGREELDQLLYEYELQPLPTYAKPRDVKTMPIHEIRFMQRSINYKSRENKGGYKVLDNAQALRTGRLKVSDMPAIEVWQDDDGRVWTLNHRRLSAMHLSGVVTEVPVVWASREVATSSSSQDKHWPLDNGCASDVISVDEGWAVRIVNAGCE